MVVFLVLVRPLVNRLLGREDDAGVIRVPAVLTDNLPSQSGREDFVQVSIEEGMEGQRAVPVFRKSGLVSAMVLGDGMVRIPREREGLEEGEKVTVEVYQ